MGDFGLNAAFIAGLPDVFFPSLTTIQECLSAQDADTGILTHVYTNLADHVSIKSRLGPLVIDRPSVEVSRMEGQEVRYKDLHLLLKGYYPLVYKTMYAVVDGYRYYVDNVQHDGNHLTTRLRVTSATAVEPD